MKKIIEILNRIFAPTVTQTYYFNSKKVDKMSKEMEEAFKDMNKHFEEMGKIFDKF